LRVCKNRVLRGIAGHKKEELAGGWRRMHNEELHNLYTSLNIITVIKSRRMRCVGHVACMQEMRNAYTIFARKCEGKRPLKTPKYRWEDNIRMDLR